MAYIRFIHSCRDRVCRVCGDKIVRNTWGVAFVDVCVPPKRVTLHFHEGCLSRAMDYAKAKHATFI